MIKLGWKKENNGKKDQLPVEQVTPNIKEGVNCVSLKNDVQIKIFDKNRVKNDSVKPIVIKQRNEENQSE